MIFSKKKVAELDSINLKFANSLQTRDCDFIMTENRTSIHVTSRYIFFDNRNFQEIFF